MANIFRSKEVFKKKSTVIKNTETDSTLYKPFENGEIVPVIGVYVTGEYRPPYYNNPGILLTEINSNKATVADFTQRSTSVKPDYSLNLHDIQAVDPLEIIPYTTRSTSVKPDYSLNLHDIQAVDPLEIIWFVTVKSSVKPDYSLNLHDIQIVDHLEIEYLTPINYPTAPEPMLRVTNITTNRAVVTNGTT